MAELENDDIDMLKGKLLLLIFDDNYMEPVLFVRKLHKCSTIYYWPNGKDCLFSCI